MIKTDICIVGAGPGGAATALKLSHLGIPSVLVDKAVFPRDKVCGDAISGKAATILRRIDPAIMERFEAASQAIQTEIWGIRFVSPNNKEIDVPFRPGYDTGKDAKQGYVSKRVDFDHFLVQEVAQRDNIALHPGISIDLIEKTEAGFYLANKEKTFEVAARLLIMANGANSHFSRHYAGLEKDEKHHAGAVRAYFKNVAGLHPDGFIELHFLKDIIPGYLWIFPLPGGHANVGLGMRSDHISQRRYNLTRSLTEIISTHPPLAERFKNAQLQGKITGYGLPLGSKKRRISGSHFMLVGDAGHLIDPLSGEGIGNAIYSGLIAAEQAQQCLEREDFSSKHMEAYDERIGRVLGKEMELSYRLQQMLSRPWLVSLLANWVTRNQQLIYVISQMYADLAVRKRVFYPSFWLKMLISGGKQQKSKAH
ncbi:MAG: geranylgeranyl reductase family protein [Saprospiraceae bacterium]